MTPIPSATDGTTPKLPDLRLLALEVARRGPRTTASAGHPVTVLRTDRVDISAEAARAGADLAQTLRSVRDAIHEASAPVSAAVAQAQDDLDRGTSEIQAALTERPKQRPELPTFRTQSGGVLLDARWNSIDLQGSTSKLTILVKGAGGSQMLSFASGTSLSSIAAAVDSYRLRTGVGAEYSAERGVVFRRIGETGYTSINIVDDGGMVNGGFSLIP